MADFPALPFWTDAYIADTAHLTNEEHGVYLRLLMFAWRTPGCALPDDDRRLALMVGVTPKKWATLRPIIATFWTVENGTWTQKRLTAERDFVEGRSRAGRAGAAGRWAAKSLKSDNTDDAGASAPHMPERCETDAPIPIPIREEREAIASPKNAKPPALSVAVREAVGVDPDNAPDGWGFEAVTECLTIWLGLGLAPGEIIETARSAASQSTTPIAGPRELDRAMSEAATAKRRPKPKADPKGTRLPEEWELPRPWGVWALQAGLTIPEVREQGARFKDYWHGVPGAKGRKADWQATWRNWIRRVIEERSTGGRNGKAGNAGISQGGQRVDPALANIARLAGLEGANAPD